MRISRVAALSLGAASVLLLASACSSQSSSEVAPAVQATSGFDNYFDNTAGGADVLAIITGGYPDVTESCAGTVGFNPIIITNTTDQDQVVNYTINTALGNNIYIAGASEMQSATLFDDCGGYGSNTGNSIQLTIPAGQTWSGGMMAGGADGPGTGLNTNADHNLAIGGGSNNQWYDFWLHESGINQSFENWELNYNNTGGTDPSQNLQAGLFNVVQCSPTTGSAGTQFSVTDTIISTYPGSSNAWTFNNNDAICFAFLNP